MRHVSSRAPWVIAIAGIAAAIAGTAAFFHFRKGSSAQQQQPAPPPQVVVSTPPQAPSTPPPPATGSAIVTEPPVKTIKPRAGSAVVSATPAGPAPLDPYAGSSAPAAPLDFCAASCRTLASCHLGSRTCEADCARPGSVHDCLAQAQGDCNRFAACMFAGYCSQLPIGTHSCSEAMDCESSCGGDQVCVWVNRIHEGLWFACRYPLTDIAQKNMRLYAELLRDMILSAPRQPRV